MKKSLVFKYQPPTEPLGRIPDAPGTPSLPVNTLRDALANHHLPARITTVGRDTIKITPGKGIDRKAVEAMVDGFIAGFNA